MIRSKLEKILLKVQKPGKYVGGELNAVIKNKEDVDVRFAFCFPDTYEIGMSHLGMKILYSQFNSKPYIWCERVFAPWIDMEEQMKKHSIPLYALESMDPISEFDFIGFTLQYELSYTNMLNMLKLGNIPLKSSDRTQLKNIVVACNREVMAKWDEQSNTESNPPVMLPELSCHWLRHTFATRCCEARMDPKAIQSILGHADYETTMNIYVEATDHLKKGEIRYLDNYYKKHPLDTVPRSENR